MIDTIDILKVLFPIIFFLMIFFALVIRIRRDLKPLAGQSLIDIIEIEKKKFFENNDDEKKKFLMGLIIAHNPTFEKFWFETLDICSKDANPRFEEYFFEKFKSMSFQKILNIIKKDSESQFKKISEKKLDQFKEVYLSGTDKEKEKLLIYLINKSPSFEFFYLNEHGNYTGKVEKFDEFLFKRFSALPVEKVNKIIDENYNQGTYNKKTRKYSNIIGIVVLILTIDVSYLYFSSYELIQKITIDDAIYASVFTNAIPLIFVMFIFLVSWVQILHLIHYSNKFKIFKVKLFDYKKYNRDEKYYFIFFVILVVSLIVVTPICLSHTSRVTEEGIYHSPLYSFETKFYQWDEIDQIKINCKNNNMNNVEELLITTKDRVDVYLIGINHNEVYHRDFELINYLITKTGLVLGNI